MRENLTYGLMRGDWKPGMVLRDCGPVRKERDWPPDTCSHGASLLLYERPAKGALYLSAEMCRPG